MVNESLGLKQRVDSAPALQDDDLELPESLLISTMSRRLGIRQLPADFLLSVVIPVFNERQTIGAVVERVQNVGLPCEIILVDDGSTDGTHTVLERLREHQGVTVRLHDKNRGKGAAVRTGLLQAVGDVVVIQDADMEYDPQELRYLLAPILDDAADIVYGSRFSNAYRPVLTIWRLAANKLITVLFNLLHGYWFTDVETCYKMFRREVIQAIAPSLRENRFGFELEVTARLLHKPGVRFCELPISYAPRSYAEGKKISWRDGIRAMWCIIRY